MPIIVTGHGEGNNLASFTRDGAEAYACSIEKLTRINCRFEFSIKWKSSLLYAATARFPEIEDFGETATYPAVYLQTRNDADPLNPGDIGNFDFNISPVSIEWSKGTNLGTIKETYRAYGNFQLSIDNVDPGIGPITIDGQNYYRPGPRYSFELAGSEYRVKRNPIGVGQPADLVLSSPYFGFPFPFRLVMRSGQPAGFLIANIIAAGNVRPTTIQSRADQISHLGSPQSRVYLRIYQKSRYYPQLPHGIPVDIVAPPL